MSAKSKNLVKQKPRAAIVMYLIIWDLRRKDSRMTFSRLGSYIYIWALILFWFFKLLTVKE